MGKTSYSQAVSKRQDVIDALPDHPAGVSRKAKIAGETAYKWLKRLHKEGEVHICRWEYTHKFASFKSPVYAYGAGQDAPKPKLQVKSDFEKDQQREINRTHRFICGIPKRPAKWFEALYRN